MTTTKETSKTGATGTKHTPGPWQVIEDGATIAGTRPGQPYAYTLAETGGYKEEREANAQLIAAAPDLLEALENLATSSELFPGELHEKHPDVLKARAAILKAKGGNK